MNQFFYSYLLISINLLIISLKCSFRLLFNQFFHFNLYFEKNYFHSNFINFKDFIIPKYIDQYLEKVQYFTFERLFSFKILVIEYEINEV